MLYQAYGYRYGRSLYSGRPVVCLRHEERNGEFEAMYDIEIVETWNVCILVVSSKMRLQLRFFDGAQYGHVGLGTERRIF